ncbi:polyprenyl synthetase family protein [Streptomyces sp. NPDC088097]|uniref:polyprenyl synthetase family protein n=1 Tax=Streptomyces sp. NPDC088097 TaxID=3365823 RepID=UPI0037F78C03
MDKVLHHFLAAQERVVGDLPELALFTGLLRGLLTAGGKRIRPLLCVIGWHAVTGRPPPVAVWRAAAALELFHAFSLIHDDVMDDSAIRRGKPTAQHVLAGLHPGHPRAHLLGTNAAILLGDLALGWSYELLNSPEITPPQAATLWPHFNALRIETLVGQYLDLAATGQSPADPAPAWRIIRYKTARYTVERPLLLGAVLADAAPRQLRALSEYALPLGEAFQLRDDLLGVYGDPRQTGKSALEDLRDGKQTVLVALATRHGSTLQRRILHTQLGNRHLTEAGADQIREVLDATGARRAVEQMITDRRRQALAALDGHPLRSAAADSLRSLAEQAEHRTT